MVLTYEFCETEALKYKHRTDLRDDNPSVYRTIHKNGWLELFLHMIQKGRIYTYENCEKEALKFDDRKKFTKESPAYLWAIYRHKWHELLSHIPISGNKYKRMIYVYEFSDKFCYVGLTYNLNNRHNRHLNDERSGVYKHIKICKSYNLIEKSGYIHINKATKLESKIIKEYKDNNWNILNGAKAGALGGNILKWTKEECVKEALKHNQKSKFKEKSPSAYNSARKNNWLDEICSHMEIIKLPNGHWNDKENCKNKSLEYDVLLDFTQNEKSCYGAILSNGWLDELCSHMERVKKPNGYYNDKEKCRVEALKHKKREHFQKKSSTAYNWAYKNGWLDEICSHMIVGRAKNGFYNNKERCEEVASKCKTRKEFSKKCWSAWYHSKENNWLDDFYPLTRKPEGYWNNKESCRKEAKKYKNRSEFSLKCSNAYEYSRTNNWLDEFFFKILKK